MQKVSFVRMFSKKVINENHFSSQLAFQLQQVLSAWISEGSKKTLKMFEKANSCFFLSAAKGFAPDPIFCNVFIFFYFTKFMYCTAAYDIIN